MKKLILPLAIILFGVALIITGAVTGHEAPDDSSRPAFGIISGIILIFAGFIIGYAKMSEDQEVE